MSDNFMAPIIDRIWAELDTASVRHRPCLQTIGELRTNAVTLTDYPESVPLVRNGNTLKPILIMQLQQYRLQMAVHGMYKTFTAVESARPKAITIGVLWGKPYVDLYPLRGITADDWMHHFAPFHYGIESKAICVGGQFRIGEASDPDKGVDALANVLSWVNLTDAMLTMLSAVQEYPNGPWAMWATAITAIQNGQPQDVFTPCLSFNA